MRVLPKSSHLLTLPHPLLLVVLQLFPPKGKFTTNQRLPHNKTPEMLTMSILALRCNQYSQNYRKKRRGATRIAPPWPSVSAVFDMVKPADRNYLVWQDLVDAKNLLEKMRADPEAPVPISDEYLRNSFVYTLVKGCEEDLEYEEIVKSVFHIVSGFGRGRAATHALQDAAANKEAPSPVRNKMFYDFAETPRSDDTVDDGATMDLGVSSPLGP